MNCDEAEEEIWIFHELTIAEQKQVEVHLLECVACREKMKQAGELNTLVIQAKTTYPRPKSEQALTDRIMRALPENEQAPLLILALEVFDRSWLQNSLRAAAIVLISIFVWESVQDPIQLTKALSEKNTVELNSFDFIKAYQQKRTAPQKITYYARYQKIKKSSI